ncbi:FxsA family protein [Corynebacterium terpenotabidum]|uniref:Phage T7 F exclusion suppressor FxsA n=1 Tax=Corynebacterium terpenotabidum Y-11 TaxID=1200352 RepID=S4XJJ0_9CORY|nr:FxsA family protein [Corynebacterium terpenotabidum]AGP30743.1 hypothetical protein A606_05480 [Corynebacterium terpenotabidum Y-11]
MLRLLLLLYPLVEIVTFVLVGQWLGFGWAFLILLVTPFIGAALAGWSFRRLRARIPSQRSDWKRTDTFTADIAATIIDGALLVVPGILTFVLGLLMLIAPVRSLVASRIGRVVGLRVMTLGERFTVASSNFRNRRSGDSGTGDSPDSSGGTGWGDVIDHRSDEFSDGSTDDIDNINDTDNTGTDR